MNQMKKIVWFEARGYLVDFIHRLSDYYNSSLSITRVTRVNEDKYFYLLLGPRGAYCFITLKRINRNEVGVQIDQVSNDESNSEDNEANYDRFKRIVPDLVNALTDGIDPADFMNFHNTLGNPKWPLTPMERQAKKEKEKVFREKRREQGFYTRTLLDINFETTSTVLYKLIEDFKQQEIAGGSSFWSVVLASGIPNDKSSWNLSVLIPGEDPIYKGYLDFLPINEKITHLKIRTTEDVSSPGDQHEEAAYFEAVDELSKLANFLKKRLPVFSIQPTSVDVDRESQEVNSFPKVENQTSVPSKGQPFADGKKVWETVPEDPRSSQLIVRMWWESNTYKAIAERVGLSWTTIRNRLKELRDIYGKEVVPYKKKVR
jgi:hypothetical protein